MPPVLVLYYSRHGSTARLAREIAKGVEAVGVPCIIRTVAPVRLLDEPTAETIPSEGPPYVSAQDIESCSALALGSPTRFGNMAAAMKHFIDSTSKQWLGGALINKPGCVFTSTSSLHGGQESTLLSMMLPLLHHGMVLCGLPYSEAQLHTTQSGGTPYGVTHVATEQQQNHLTSEEKALCFAQGKRLAILAKQLNSAANEQGK
jgi:NAD(P)H dehydrogenase (quinone)